MRADDRTTSSVRNSFVGVAAKILAIVAGYITRVILVRVLSTELVGVNGLLTNIMGSFALTTLGVDTALVYSMYTPVAQQDLAKQRALMRLYNHIYHIFAAVVLVFCLLIYPFLPVLIRERAEISGLYLICALYILNTVLSYFWSYKRMMFLVTQNNYINELFDAGFWLLQYLLQCILLLTTGSYILFLLSSIVCTLVRNILLTHYADRCFPFLNEPATTEVEPAERKSIMRNIRAMLFHKIGTVVINNTDNMLLTSMFGLGAVGSYSNYYLITGSVQQVLDRMINGITASVGNLGATEDRDHVAKVFRLSFFITAWVYGFASIALYCVLSSFIELSFGTTYLLPDALTAVICLNLYLNGIRRATLVFRDSLGLFWHDRYKTLIEATVNLLSSILLAWWLGPTGVFVGTTVSIVLISLWVEPLVLYKEYLKQPLAPYFQRFLLYLGGILAAAFVTRFACLAVSGGPLLRFLIRGVISVIVPNAVILLLSQFLWEYAAVKEAILLPLDRKLKDMLFKKHTH